MRLRIQNSSAAGAPRHALAQILGHARCATDEIGFIPRPAAEFYFSRGRYQILHDGDQVLAWCLTIRRPYETRVLQLFTPDDLRRQLFATALTAAVESDAAAAGADSVTLRCADDIDGHKFWSSLGYAQEKTRPRQNRRKRAITRFRKLIVPLGTRFPLFHRDA